jgi:hypothetical protein
MATAPFQAGGYRYIPGPFQYSAGVAAEPGFTIERVRFAKLLPLAAGFAAVEAHLAQIGRPVTAFCACELRSPAQFSEAGFIGFNRGYVEKLALWGHYRDGVNPVARSNVCPETDQPPEPSFFAFSYTVPGQRGFVVAGSGEAQEGAGSYADRIIRLGDTSSEGMHEKARYVVGEMTRRLTALGFDWVDVTALQVYTVHDLHPILDEIIRPGVGPTGLTWYRARPPVEGLDFEMDVRGLARELVL